MSATFENLRAFGLKEDIESEAQFYARLDRSTIVAQEALRANTISPMHPVTLKELHKEIYGKVFNEGVAGITRQDPQEAAAIEDKLADWYATAMGESEFLDRTNRDEVIDYLAWSHAALRSIDVFPFGNDRVALLSLHAQIEFEFDDIAFPSRELCKDYLKAVKQVAEMGGGPDLRTWIATALDYGKQMLIEAQHLEFFQEKLRQAKELDVTREF